MFFIIILVVIIVSCCLIILSIFSFITIIFIWLHISYWILLFYLTISFLQNILFIPFPSPFCQSSNLYLLTVRHKPFSTVRYLSFVSFFLIYLLSQILISTIIFLLLILSFNDINVIFYFLILKVIFIVCSYVFVIAIVFVKVIMFFALK